MRKYTLEEKLRLEIETRQREKAINILRTIGHLSAGVATFSLLCAVATQIRMFINVTLFFGVIGAIALIYLYDLKNWQRGRKDV